MIIRELKKHSTKQSFFHDALQTYGRDWIRFDQNEKKITYKAGQISRLFQEFKTLYEPLEL